MRRPQPDPPRRRHWICGHVYHIYQRGSQRQNTFLHPAHLILYLIRLDQLARRYKVRIHAFCLMSNHVHFLFEPQRKGGISKLMQHLQGGHARYMNGLKHTQGHLWRNHFHAKPIKSQSQYRDTLIYIEKNPTAASLTQQAHRYAYSSAAAHLANDPRLIVKHKHLEAQLTLYLNRWRQAFEITPETNWAHWLHTSRPAILPHLKTLIGQPPPKPIPLHIQQKAAARGS